MKNFKRILSLLLVFIMLATAVCQLVSCGDDGGDGGNTTPPDDNPSDETTTYTVEVKSIGGLKLSGVLVELYAPDGSLGGRGVRTDSNGIANFVNFPKNTYKAKLSDVPDGYIVNADGYDIGKPIVLISQVISDPDTTGVVYKLGDIIHDFTVTTTDGKTWTLSEVLKEKDAVMINFWYTTCTYCIGEFPDFEEAYKKYAEKMGVIAINGHSQEKIEDVLKFEKSFYHSYSYGVSGSILNKLASNELTKIISSNISNIFKENGIENLETAFDDALNTILNSDDKKDASTKLAEAIESAVLDENDTKFQTVLANFASKLKEVDVENTDSLNKVFENVATDIYNSFALDLPLAKDTMTNPVEDPFEAAFGDSWGNPVSVIVDRYGVISMIHLGALQSERHFSTVFEYFTDANYEQTLVENVDDLVPVEKPDVELPENYYDEIIKDVLVKDEASKELITFEPEQGTNDAEYAWPFIVAEKNGEKYVTTSNTGKDSSYSILHAKVSLKAGEALVIDYYASMQVGYDYFYVLVDGEDVYSISLLNKEWKGLCPYVAVEDGVYDVVFLYYKDSTNESGEDAVHIKNFRVVNKDNLEVEAYIPREAATKPTEDMSDYTEYVTVVLGDDGYYHVGTKDGPILIASLLNGSSFTDEYSVSMKLYETYEEASDAGIFMVDGVNKFDTFIQYCNYASNANIYGYCSVTEELKGLLDEFVKQNGNVYHENTWLQLCSYFDVYGKDENGEPVKQLDDIIKGLASFSAPVIDFTPVIDEQNSDNSILLSKNYSITVSRVVMPRGYLYAFTPTVSGVYRFTTNSTQEVVGWIFTGGHDEWIANGDRTLYVNGDQGERYCEELLVMGADGKYVRDFTNASMVAQMEKGKTYYIAFAYYDVYSVGTFTFNVKFEGHKFDMFHVASPGTFTYEITSDEQMGDLIVGGIDVELGADDYYYHRLTNTVISNETVTMTEDDKYYSYENGTYYEYSFENDKNQKSTITISDGKKTVKVEEYTLGSLVYADFYFTTSIFTQNSLEAVINNGGFDFTKTEIDNEGLVYLENYYDLDNENPWHKLEKLWGADFEFYRNFYQFDDLLNGKYHGNGENYTAEAKEYLKLKDDGITNPERQGCVAVDKHLGELLQMLMDKYTFKVDKSWTKLCYYYEYLGWQE